MKLKNNNQGFTLIELIIVIAIASIIMAIAVQSYISIIKGAKFREASRGIASVLRDARSRAVNHNLEYRVSFNVANSRYQLQQGNSNSGSTTWTPVYSDWMKFQSGVTMAAPSTCDDFATDRTIQFNPNGSANSLYVCVMDGATEKYQVGVSSITTGRVLIQ